MNKLLVLIISLSLLVRVVGFFPGHSPDHPDEPMSYESAVEMIGHGDLNPRRYDYPAGVPLLHYVFYSTFVLPAIFLRVYYNHPQEIVLHFINPQFYTDYSTEIFGVNDIDALFWSRFLTAILGTLSVYMVYITGKKMFNSLAGISGAFFLAFDYRHVLSSHLALSDIPNSFFAFLSFYTSLLLLEKNTKKRYFLGSLCVALSIAMKYQVFAVFPFLLAHAFWMYKKRKFSYVFHKDFLISLFLIPIVFCALNPYLFINIKTAIPVIQYVGGRYGAGADKYNFFPMYYLYYFGIGSLALISIGLGLLFGLCKSFFKTLFILSYVFPFLFVFLYYMLGGSFIRNFTTVMPFFALFFGYFVSFILYKFHLQKKWIVVLLLLFVLNFQSIINSFTLSTNYIKPWNRDILNSWIEKNIPVNTQVRTDNVSIAYNADKPLTIIPWNHAKENSISEFEQNQDAFAVINTDWYQGWMFWFDTPYKQLLQSPGIPYNKLKDSYYGLSLLEFKNYTVKEIYKPWQSPDNDYLVLKIPELPKDKGEKIKDFTFDSSLENWKYNDFSFQKGESDMLWNNGNLELNGKFVNGENSRFSSPYIKVQSGKTYTIEALVKPIAPILPDQRDLFLRADFFTNQATRLPEFGIQTSVSGRAYGGDVTKLTIIVTAPTSARFLSVSLQRANYVPPFRYLIDDVSIFETDEKLQDKFKKIPYIKTTIPDNVLFPNSIY